MLRTGMLSPSPSYSNQGTAVAMQRVHGGWRGGEEGKLICSITSRNRTSSVYCACLSLSLCVCVWVCVCVCVCVYMRVYVCVCLCLWVWMYLYVRSFQKASELCKYIM